MIRLRGVAAAPGVAVAPPQLLERSVAGGERLDLDAAVDLTVRQLEALAARLAAGGRPDEAAIFEAQILLARDVELLAGAREAVDGGTPADDAITAAGEAAAAMLADLDDELLAGRAADVRDVAARIARAVRGESVQPLTRRVVVVARDLAPSVTAELDASLMAAIALEGGSRTSHAAILARALGIPAVVAVPGLLAAVTDAVAVVVDGARGEVVLEPDSAERARADAAIAADDRRRESDRAYRDRPLATADGTRIMLAANVGRPEDAPRAVEAGAEGVGLLRTEFLFADRSAAPDEATQAAAYASVLRAFGERPVVVRLLDVGGDKPLPYVPMPPEANPFLGVRAIRLAGPHPDLLRTQLRAILAAAAAAGVAEPHLMAPMVADLADLRAIRALLDEALVAHPALRPRLGIMVEVPSAVLVADQLATEAAFFSIGTNDLTQYLLAADRTNPALAERQDPRHPAVLRAVARVVEGARGRAVPVAVCGEMAGDALGAVLLVGLGVTELSMEPAAFASVKRALAAVTLADARELATRALEAIDAAAVAAMAADAVPAD